MRFLCAFACFLSSHFCVFTVLGKAKNDDERVIETLNTDPTCFQICGESQEKVSLAKTQLQQLINDQYHSLEIEDKAIKSLSKEDSQHIVDLQRSMGVSISTKSIKKISVLIVSGYKPAVDEASRKINVILQDVKEKTDAEFAGLMAVWQYRGHGFRFKNFNSKCSSKLEQARRNKASYVTVTMEDHKYTVQMPQGPATDDKGSALEINRLDLTAGILMV